MPACDAPSASARHRLDILIGRELRENGGRAIEPRSLLRHRQHVVACEICAVAKIKIHQFLLHRRRQTLRLRPADQAKQSMVLAAG